MTATGGQAARTAELENPPPALSYEALLEENLRLKEQLQQLQQQHQRQQSQQQQQQQRKKTPSTPLSCSSSVPLPPLPPVHQLTSEHITRYSRQLLLPSFGVQGQRNLLSSSVLVVGAGGLGSAVLLYLAGAGVGRLGIVDFDGVERSNLHRQVIHTEAREGGRKAWSAAESVRALNSQVEVCVYEEEVGWDNVEGLLQGRTWERWKRRKGGGRRREGGGGRRGGGGQGEQKLKRGPCYRCLYPKPLAAASGSCSENGVLGVVPGIIGCLQVMELLSLSACAAWADAHGLRGPGPSCPPSLPPSSLLPPEHEVTCQTLASLRQAGVPLFILDVREPHQFAICSLPGAVNIPFSSFPSSLPQEGLWERGGEGSLSATKEGGEQREGGRDVGMLGKDLAVYVMCRRGILSREATRVLVERGWGKVWNVRGGLVKWKEEVDRDFPIY
ncbi:adenylyltransferase and sulfurtransferase mocs3-like [Nannochloropsis oceanica]